MCKKFLFAALIIGAAVVVFKKYDVRVSRKNGSLEQQISKLNEDLAKLEKDKARYIHAEAVEELALERLDAEIKQMQTNQNEKTRALTSLVEQIDAEKQQVNFGEDKLTQAQARAEVRRLVDAVEVQKKAIQAKKELWQTRQDKLNAQKTQTSQLVNDLEKKKAALVELETRLIKLRTAQTNSPLFGKHDNHARFNAQYENVRGNLELEERKIKIEKRYETRTTPTSTKPTDKQVMEKAHSLLKKQVAGN